MRRIASCVFDLDGTISDPAAGIQRSLDYALLWFGHAPVRGCDVSRFIGPPLDQTFRTLVADATTDHVAALVAKYRERYADVGFAENVVYPGVPPVLRALDAAGVALGVCTSKRADFAERILRHFGLRGHFRFVSGGDIGVDKAAQLGSLLREGRIDAASAMIGDRAIDVTAARTHALTSVAVLWGHGSREELHAAGPDVMVAEPHELLALAATGFAPEGVPMRAGCAGG
jgi:phosphoglycolate phosphatase